MKGYQHRTVNRIARIGNVLKSVGRYRRLPANHHEFNAMVAAGYVDIRNGRCLVVGCGAGIECEFFASLDAKEVWGVDISKKIGSGYPSPRVTYHRASAEDMKGVPSDMFDLVYAHAVLEHVTDIEACLREMVRVARPGGIVYAIAAPLWNSRNGHHCTAYFDGYPWIHLRLTAEEIREHCRASGIVSRDQNISMDKNIDYMLDPAHFNMLPASRFLDAIQGLAGVQVRHNYIILDGNSYLTPEIEAELAAKGYSRTELLSLGHVFAGRKL